MPARHHLTKEYEMGLAEEMLARSYALGSNPRFRRFVLEVFRGVDRGDFDDFALALWDSLIEGGTGYGITPSGLLALDVARIEAGLILLDVDYVSAHHAVIDAQMSSPFEIGLGWTVSLDKEGFIGEHALREEKARGSSCDARASASRSITRSDTRFRTTYVRFSATK